MAADWEERSQSYAVKKGHKLIWNVTRIQKRVQLKKVVQYTHGLVTKPSFLRYKPSESASVDTKWDKGYSATGAGTCHGSCASVCKLWAPLRWEEAGPSQQRLLNMILPKVSKRSREV